MSIRVALERVGSEEGFYISARFNERLSLPVCIRVAFERVGSEVGSAFLQLLTNESLIILRQTFNYVSQGAQLSNSKHIICECLI